MSEVSSVVPQPAMSTATEPGAALAWEVHKFGGSSLADAACIRQVADIVRSRGRAGQLTVVSAMRGTTDALIALLDAAEAGRSGESAMHALVQRHLDAATQLLGDAAPPVLAWLRDQFSALEAQLRAPPAVGPARAQWRDHVQGLGEVWSSRLLSACLADRGIACAWLDAREVLVVRHGELGCLVDWEASSARYLQWRDQHPQPYQVVTGFIARDTAGAATVLGRNGSDYSAAIFAALSNATGLTIWSDTDGVLSADPRLVPDANPLPALSYNEACELAYFGAKVIHPQTLTPVIARGMPVWIRNTFAPERAGTAITASGAGIGVLPPVRGVSAVSQLALLTLEGSGMIGVPGTAERAFGALHRAGISVVMISQGSSEHSICCVVRQVDAQAARTAVLAAFSEELATGEIQTVEIADDISVIAAVGDGMTGTPGVSARLFGALARTGINIRAIAQGASERNISVAVAGQDTVRALRAVHAAFWLSPQTISIGLIGPGKVGTALLQQILAARPRLLQDYQLDLRVRAVASSHRQWLGEATAAAGWDQAAQASDGLEAFAEHVQAEHLPHALIVDCSASDTVAGHYATWLTAGIHIVTPNKHAGAGPTARWQALRTASTTSGARFRYEATVGAGLPVISTLRDLLDTGDQLLAVDGILSGTLAWLFNRYDGSQPFSALARHAHALGYTEPDPRDDLHGVDVARKLVILAREAGRKIDLADVQVESLVPEHLRHLDAQTFMQRLEDLDTPIAQRFAAARAQGQVLRHLARLDQDGHASVGLVALPQDHPFAHLRLTDNVVQFTTRRYRDNPLVVQGPGAGPDVTAAGVFADVLRVAVALGARM